MLRTLGSHKASHYISKSFSTEKALHILTERETNFFFNSRYAVETYERIEATEVEVASSVPKLVRKAQVKLLIENRKRGEAFHAPQYK